MSRHRWATQASSHAAEGEDSSELTPDKPRIQIAIGVAGVCLVLLASVCLVLFLQRPSEPLAAVRIDDIDAVSSPAPRVRTPAPDEEKEPGQTSAESPSKETTESKIIVHVAGAVKNPGIVSLPAGSRTYEAIEKAGGNLPHAALDAINLAAPMDDGMQLYVPTVGERVPATAGPGATQDTEGPVNLNTASANELEELPGVGPVLAERIISWREEHGGYSSIEDLDAVSGVGEAMMASLADLVTV